MLRVPRLTWHHRRVPRRINTELPDGMPRKLLDVSGLAELDGLQDLPGGRDPSDPCLVPSPSWAAGTGGAFPGLCDRGRGVRDDRAVDLGHVSGDTVPREPLGDRASRDGRTSPHAPLIEDLPDRLDELRSTRRHDVSDRRTSVSASARTTE